MSYAFKYASAKPTFSTVNQVATQSDYINIKKGCCVKDYNGITFNKNNLIASLFSRENLENVCTVGSAPACANPYDCNICIPLPIINANSSVPFYWTNTIDPAGELFGNSQCGVLNYANYIGK